MSASTGVAVTEVKDLLLIDQRFSSVKRVGQWVVPRRLELAAEWCEVTLDFTQAVITQDTLRIDMDMRGKTLTLVTKPGIVPASRRSWWDWDVVAWGAFDHFDAVDVALDDAWPPRESQADSDGCEVAAVNRSGGTRRADPAAQPCRSARRAGRPPGPE
ncbi:hypothetical protein ACFVYE_45475 [Streptomyces sp. NPDC058239]|uniref:hypothetical protein n=1 Tax=unclassified Streptomyces TaxID=2593676 RepID=UPI0036563305